MCNGEQYSLKAVAANEAPVAIAFIDEAKAFLRSMGVDQWQNGYPSADTIKEDIARGIGYFLMAGERPLAYMCIDLGGEMAYDGLDGHWLIDTRAYGVLHRLAMGKRSRGKGAATIAIQLAEELMKCRRMESFRIDTDENNEVMKHLLHKNGFTYCGTIWFDNSVKIAYEKLL